jgi:hypothetical protein
MQPLPLFPPKKLFKNDASFIESYVQATQVQVLLLGSILTTAKHNVVLFSVVWCGVVWWLNGDITIVADRIYSNTCSYLQHIHTLPKMRIAKESRLHKYYWHCCLALQKRIYVVCTASIS